MLVLVRDELEAAFAVSRGGAPHNAAQEQCARAVIERARPLIGSAAAERLGAHVRAAFSQGDGA